MFMYAITRSTPQSETRVTRNVQNQNSHDPSKCHTKQKLDLATCSKIYRPPSGKKLGGLANR